MTSRPLWESPSERRERTRQHREQALATSLGWLDGVQAARVHLGYADHRVRRAAVVLRTRGPDPRAEEAARELITAAVPELEGSAVSVIVVPTAAAAETATAPELTPVGPFAVSAADAPRLRGALVLLLALNAALAGGLIWLRRRQPPNPISR